MTGLEMKYFVLKPKGDDTYANASRHAMIEYARLIGPSNRKLEKDLVVWANREHQSSAYKDPDDKEVE